MAYFYMSYVIFFLMEMSIILTVEVLNNTGNNLLPIIPAPRGYHHSQFYF